MSEHHGEPIPLEKLVKVFEFTPEELVANRHGILPSTQHTRLSRRNAFHRRFATLLGLPLGIVLFLGGLFGLVNGDVLFGWIMLILLGVLIGLFIYLARVSSHKLILDLAEGTVVATSGQLTAYSVMRGQHGLSDYFLTIGEETLKINGYHYNQLKDAPGSYTAYYTPHSRIVLSMEPGENRPVSTS